jgi:hypothetical protein
MSWERGQRYRGKAVSGQFAIERNPNSGVQSVVGLIEGSMGGQLGQRIRWRGHLNSPANQETTVAELRAMGWRGAKLGDWSGLGAKEIEFSAMGDDGEYQGKSITYFRAAFVRPLMTVAVSVEKEVVGDELDALNASLGGLLGTQSNGGPPARGPAPIEADPWDKRPDDRLSGS